MLTREKLGKLVREVWVAYCRDNGDTQPSHIAEWEQLSEYDKEVDRQIGEAVAQHVLGTERTFIEPDRPSLSRLTDWQLRMYWHNLHNGALRDHIGDNYANLDDSEILKEAGVRWLAVECSCGLRGTCPKDWKCTENLMWLEPDS